ncbi:MAG: PP2C family protein-serine/threonine phosphatase [Bdellovibrionales bacterium]
MQKRIQELETALKARDQELYLYREEISQLNKRIEQFIGQVSSEIQMMNTIHKLLVPTEIPTIPGFEFSTKFEASALSGGDYYDIFELEDRLKFGVLLSSASGHGLSALLLAVLLKMNSQVKARRGAGPQEIVKNISQEIQNGMKDLSGPQQQQVASLFFGLVDRRRFELAYCSMGQILGLHLSHANGNVEVFHSSGEALSQQAIIPQGEHSLALQPRDRIVIVSPGLFMAKNAGGEVFGSERIKKILQSSAGLSTHELRHNLFYEHKKFISGLENNRDLTVLVIEVQDRVIKLAR